MLNQYKYKQPFNVFTALNVFYCFIYAYVSCVIYGLVWKRFRGSFYNSSSNHPRLAVQPFKPFLCLPQSFSSLQLLTWFVKTKLTDLSIGCLHGPDSGWGYDAYQRRMTANLNWMDGSVFFSKIYRRSSIRAPFEYNPPSYIPPPSRGLRKYNPWGSIRKFTVSVFSILPAFFF